MDKAFLIGLQAIIFVALSTLSVVYLQWVYSTAFPGATADRVAPFIIVGKSDTDAKALAVALPEMFVARLSTLRAKIDSTIQTLKTADIQGSGTPATPQVVGFQSSITIPEDFWSPPDIQLKIGDVDAGGLLNWIFGSIRDSQSLRVSVLYENEKTFITGRSDTATSSIDIEADQTNRNIIENLSYAVLQQAAAAEIPNLSVLRAEQFRELVASLDQLAGLKTKASLGGVTPAAFADILAKLETQADELPGWRALQRLAAELAESSDQLEKAVRFYERTLKLVREKTEQERITTLIATLNSKIAQRSGAVIAAAPLPDPASGTQRPPLFSLLKVPATPMPRDITVGIVGMPTQILPGIDVETIDVGTSASRSASSNSADLDDYHNSLLFIIRRIAPRAKLVGARLAGSESGFLTSAALLRAIEGLLDKKVDVLLIPYGPLDSESGLLTRISSQVLVVVPAGNEGPGETARTHEGVLIAASVTLDGRRSAFTTGGPNVLWAPGDDLSRAINAPSNFGPLTGTSYSAALAAAAGAWVLSSRNDLLPSQALNALRRSSKALSSEPNAPAVIQIEDAIKLAGG